MKVFKIMLMGVDGEPTITASRVTQIGKTEVMVNGHIHIDFDEEILSISEQEPYHPEQDLFTGKI